MTRFLYCEINFIGVMIMAVILFQQRRASQTRRQTAFNRLAVSLVLILLFDTFMLLLGRRTFPGARILMWCSTICYYVLNCLIPFFWFVYILVFFQRDLPRHGKKFWLYALPAAIGVLVTVLNLFHPLIFSIDAQNVYARADWFALPLITSGLYLFSGILVACHSYRLATQAAHRQECLQMIGILALPILGTVIQVLFYGVPTIWISCVLAMLITFLHFQNRQIAIDALTGLNNRYQLSRYIVSLGSHAEQDTPYLLTMIDVDGFKQINDRYGHVLGDRALIAAADVLKNACRNTSAFLARYGGDEFLLIAPLSQHGAILNAVDAGLAALNASALLPFPLSMSSGSAPFTPRECADIDRVITQADRQMYREKTEKLP